MTGRGLTVHRQRRPRGRRKLFRRRCETASADDSLGGRCGRVRPVSPGNPFLDVARDVQQAERAHVRGERSYRRRPFRAVHLQIGQPRQSPVAPQKTGVSGPSRSLLPLLFGGQMFAGQLAERRRIIAAHVDHGVLVSQAVAGVPGGGLGPDAAGPGTIVAVQAIGDFQAVDIVGRQPDLVGRGLIAARSRCPSEIHLPARASSLRWRFGGRREAREEPASSLIARNRLGRQPPLSPRDVVPTHRRGQ